MSSVKFWKQLFTNKQQKPVSSEIDISVIDDSFKELTNVAKSVAIEAYTTNTHFQKKLELFERKFAVITDSVDDMIIVKTINRSWVSINKFACQILHINRDMIIGKTNSEVAEIYPKLKPILQKLDDAERESWDKRKTIKFKLSIEENRRTIYLDIMITPIDNGDNSIQELIIIGHNNTKFYETLKRGSFAFEMLNSSSSPICVIDSNKRFNFVNTEFENKFNVNHQKVVNLEFYQIFHGDLSVKLNTLIEESTEVPSTIEFDEYFVDVMPIINSQVFVPIYYILSFRKKNE